MDKIFWSGVFGLNRAKGDRAFSLLDQKFSQILVLCLPSYLFSKSWKKIGATRKIWEKAVTQTFEGSDREKCQF